MDDSPHSSPRLTVLTIAAIAVPLLVVLYVLSAGPASWLAENDYVPGEWLVPVYWPLGIAIRSSQDFADFMFLYIERCGAVPAFSPANLYDGPWFPPSLPAD